MGTFCPSELHALNTANHLLGLILWQLGEQIHDAQSTRTTYELARTDDDIEFDEEDIALVDRGLHSHSLSSQSTRRTTLSPPPFSSIPHDREEPSLSARASRTNLTDEDFEPDPASPIVRTVRIEVGGGMRNDQEAQLLMEDGLESSGALSVMKETGVGDKAGVILVRFRSPYFRPS